MSREINFVLEPDRGRVTVESSNASLEIEREIKSILGKSVAVNCGRPQISVDSNCEQKQENLSAERGDVDSADSVHLFRLFHHSTVDGPGRRTVVQFAGCSIRCSGCYVPETHERSNGRLTSIEEIVAEIIEREDEHDGVTILGGEPFDQIDGLEGLVFELKRRDFHVIIYSGYRLEDLLKRKNTKIRRVLENTDLLIDGAFERKLIKNSGEYRGSSNQRLILHPLV